MNNKQFRSELQTFIDHKVKAYEESPDSFIELWPLLGEKNLFGVLSCARREKDIQLFNKHLCILEELSKITISGFLLSFITQGWIIAILERLVSNEYQKVILHDLKKGRKIGAFCLTEPQYGSSYSNLQTKATKKGDIWEITGEKIYITNSEYADHFIVIANTSIDANESLTFFLIPRKMEGLDVEKSIKLSGNQYSGMSKVIINCKQVDEKFIVGKPGNGFFILPECLQSERLDIAICSVAVAKESLIRTVKFLSNRKSNHNRKLVSYQVIQHRLADMYSKIELIDCFVKNTANKYLNKRLCTKEVTISKICATEAARDILQELMELHGAYGYLKEGYLSTMFNNIAPLVNGGGSNTVLRGSLFNNLNIDETGNLLW